jgi:hypothetical protein
VIRNERYFDGVCVEADCYDLDTRTYTREEMGVVVVTRPMTDDEVRQFGPQPLDALGSLATLLAVESVLTVEDAANAVGLTPTDLVNEAEAWAAASA